MRRIDVAVGIITNTAGEVLIAKRLAHQHQGECWEFPGGKLESSESVQEALKRELHEEVGIDVLASEPWFHIEHDYIDKPVRLNVYKVTSFQGTPFGKEGQEVCWVNPRQLHHYAWPKANEAIVKALQIE